MEKLLFALPEPSEPKSQFPEQRVPRVKRPERAQIQLRPVDLDSMIPADHTVRLVWGFVEKLDLSPLYGQIRAVEGHAGQSAIDPAILMGLWLYATLEGVGSARALDRLCQEHDAYRWLCGGVSVNYHTLADFRVQHEEVLNGLLTKSVAVLIADGLVSLKRVAQDGKRVRASAGASSFHTRPTLEKYLEEAHQQVETLRKELEENPAATSKRQKAARERAARERQERVQKALERMEEVETHLKKQEKKRAKHKRKKNARTSTTEAGVNVMKMADGGFRPAHNTQFCTDTASQVIVGVDASAQGNDNGLARPMFAQVHERYGCYPGEYLVDDGFVNLDDITYIAQKGTQVYMPVNESRNCAIDPFEPKHTDSPEVGAWRQRMASPQAQEIYKLRAATAECVNAIQHNRGLQAVRVRGLQKVKAVLLWFALAHNLLREIMLRRAVAQPLAG